jgi:hypothetical protein
MTEQMFTLSAYRKVAATFHSHARGCKKSPFECGSCVSAMRWFAALPAQVLALVLQEASK